MRGNRYQKIVIILLLFTISGLVDVKDCMGQSSETMLKAGYIEKFTHFIQWPDLSENNHADDPFTIAVIGKNTLGNSLEELFSTVKINNKEVLIKYITNLSEVTNNNILFISESEEDNLDEILKYTTGKSVLTISDSKGFGKRGVLINLFMEDNYIRYEVNSGTLEKSGLNINSLLLNYAVIIKSDG